MREILQRGVNQRQTEQGDPVENVTSVLMRLGLEALFNRALEEERTDFLGRERYERTPAEQAEARERSG